MLHLTAQWQVRMAYHSGSEPGVYVPPRKWYISYTVKHGINKAFLKWEVSVWVSCHFYYKHVEYLAVLHEYTQISLRYKSLHWKGIGLREVSLWDQGVSWLKSDSEAKEHVDWKRFRLREVWLWGQGARRLKKGSETFLFHRIFLTHYQAVCGKFISNIKGKILPDYIFSPPMIMGSLLCTWTKKQKKHAFWRFHTHDTTLTKVTIKPNSVIGIVITILNTWNPK
jgi:hypothetical protein